MNDRQQDDFWGYRPLLTHNRKRNAIPAVESEYWLRWPVQPGTTAPRRSLPPAGSGLPVQRDQSARFRAKVDALIERFKPFASRTRERDRKWTR